MVFAKVLQHVNTYFLQALESGQNPEEIMQSFRYNPLPTELTKNTDASDAELRRVGQILSTQYILDQKEQQTRITTIPGFENEN